MHACRRARESADPPRPSAVARPAVTRRVPLAAAASGCSTTGGLFGSLPGEDAMTRRARPCWTCSARSAASRPPRSSRGLLELEADPANPRRSSRSCGRPLDQGAARIVNLDAARPARRTSWRTPSSPPSTAASASPCRHRRAACATRRAGLARPGDARRRRRRGRRSTPAEMATLARRSSRRSRRAGRQRRPPPRRRPPRRRRPGARPDGADRDPAGAAASARRVRMLDQFREEVRLSASTLRRPRREPTNPQRILSR